MKKLVVGTVAMLSLAGVSGQVSAAEPAAIKTSTVGTENSIKVQAAETQIAAVTSLSTPQEGQKNRSSGNFSVENLPAGTYALKFVVEGGNSGTHFNVMKDVSGGTDPTIWSNVYSGNTTDVQTDRSFYIANPSGTNSNFTVKVYALH
ncbi:DeoR family transcriptional regulator [Priestia endophytica]|uniref:DeoR family transcriptional regulator n=1 Tax=Priestia endophytica TaxID=135735 RepID=UPI002281C6F9|nr:DeoR family transcriptional regulator [Priestia endophytica]MCY8233496.1 DeoR family transcriptional regulator [Priestia endophytica]